MAFWKIMFQAFQSMNFHRSKTDPWTKLGLVIWLSWIDNCLVIAQSEGVRKAKKMMTDWFDCDIIGNMDEYVGCKIERNEKEGWIRFTQPVLLQSYTDEFDLTEGTKATTPADDGQLLVPCDPHDGERRRTKHFSNRSWKASTHDEMV
jgi:hypothetical protein